MVIIVIIIIEIMMFIDRSKEMNSLQKRYRSDDFEFIVIYGQRSIGKTELIKQFSKDKPSIDFYLNRICRATLEENKIPLIFLEFTSKDI